MSAFPLDVEANLNAHTPAEYSPTHSSRHDTTTTPRYSAVIYDLPAYSETPSEEPTTLAYCLFKFGFLFPLFWILGSIILVSPLTAPSDFHANKPESERQQLVSIVRQAEMKWARRCLYAFITLVLILALGLSIGIALTHR